MNWRTILYPLGKVDPGEITRLREAGDTRGLVRLLSHPDPGVQDRAAVALSTLGSAACDPLLSALGSSRPLVRMGAAEALASIPDPRSGDALARLLGGDPVDEVRWAAAVAIGPLVRAVEVGDQVLFEPEERAEVELRGLAYVLLRERDIHAVAAARVAEAATGLYL
jgi:HEAT repeat protein